MAVTTLKIEKGDIIIRLMMMTVQRDDGYVDVDVVRVDEKYEPIADVTPSIGVSDKNEVDYHTQLRKEATEKGQFVPEYSTNPEWNPGYVEEVINETVEKTLEDMRFPCIVEELDPDNITKGINESTFQIKLDIPKYYQGDIITYDKHHGAEMHITDADIIDAGDGFIYTVELVNNEIHKFIENKFLQKGMWIFLKGSSRSSYGNPIQKIIKQ